MLAALVAGFLIFSGGDGFAARLFSKDTQAIVRQVIADPARAEVADRTIELGRQDFEELGKQFEKIAKGFSKADTPTHTGIPTAGVGSAKVVVTTFLSVSESGTKYGSSEGCPKGSLTVNERQ
jgi:hypothetical protein